MTYFIELKRISLRNDFDKEIKRYIYDRYSDSVINDESIDAMEDDIKCKIEELHKKYPLSEDTDFCRYLATNNFSLYSNKTSRTIFEIHLNLIIREYTEGVGL